MFLSTSEELHAGLKQKLHLMQFLICESELCVYTSPFRCDRIHLLPYFMFLPLFPFFFFFYSLLILLDSNVVVKRPHFQFAVLYRSFFFGLLLHFIA